MRRCVASFSGGETSAYMTYKILTDLRDRWGEVVVVFANASKGREECLAFVDRCDREIFTPLGSPVNYVEAVVTHEHRAVTKHRRVSFASANRDGSVFEQVIQKYGIPNMEYPHCTRELKLRPIRSFVDSLGWDRGTYDMAVGIRADEADRIAGDAAENGVTYPLISLLPTRKPEVNTFWRRQPWRLNLKGYQGNCQTCWKKTDRKLYQIAKENPEFFDFTARMEAQYADAGAGKGGRVFYRKKRSTADILRESLEKTFEPPTDDAQVYDEELDAGGGCGESCEVFSDHGMF